jgi:dihydroorotate dehydrogenase electron transfer subunit
LEKPTRIDFRQDFKIRSVKDIVSEAGARTIVFDDMDCAKASPGQFAMVWVPDKVNGGFHHELSLSLGIEDDGLARVMFRPNRHEMEVLNHLGSGDEIGIIGPLGKGFKIPDGSGTALLVGGGTGVVSIASLARSMNLTKRRVHVIIGARTRDELLLVRRLEQMQLGKLEVFTEDGTFGKKGTAKDSAVQAIANGSIDGIFVSGSETLIQGIFDAAERNGMEVQACVEWSLRCGIGVCGLCSVGQYLICTEGPTFQSEELEEICGGLLIKAALAQKDELARREDLTAAFREEFSEINRIDSSVIEGEAIEDARLHRLVEARRNIDYIAKLDPSALSSDDPTSAKEKWVSVVESIMTKCDLKSVGKLLSFEPTIIYDTDLYEVLKRRRESNSDEIAQVKETLHSFLNEYTKRKLGVPMEENTRKYLANELIYLLLSQKG